MRSIHRGWCRCTRCYTRHRNEQQLYEQESSDRTSVHEADYDWMYDQMVITPHDPSVSLNPPVLAAVALAPVPAILASDDDISINTISVIPSNPTTTPRCVFDSGANRHIFNHESWIMDTNSYGHFHLWYLRRYSSLLPMHHWTSSYLHTAKDDIMSIGWLSQFPSIITTFSSVDNTFRVTLGTTTFVIPVA